MFSLFLRSVWHYLLFHIVSSCSQRLALNEICVRCMFESTKYLIFSYSKYFNKYFQYVSNLDLTWPVDQLQLTRFMLLIEQCLHSFEAWLGHRCWYSINTFFSFSVDGSADWRVQNWIYSHSGDFLRLWSKNIYLCLKICSVFSFCCSYLESWVICYLLQSAFLSISFYSSWHIFEVLVWSVDSKTLLTTQW